MNPEPRLSSDNPQPGGNQRPGRDASPERRVPKRIPFRERLEDKTKNWKFSPADLKEREYWDAYIAAYEDMLRKCSTKEAPWYVIPANHKWFRNLAVSQIMREELEGMKLKYPKPSKDLSEIRFE